MRSWRGLLQADISEGCKFLHVAGGKARLLRPRARRLEMSVELIQLCGHGIKCGFRFLRKVSSGFGIRGEVVQFRMRSTDVEILSDTPRFESAPTEAFGGKIGAGIDGL